MKQCSTCKCKKELSKFWNDSNAKDGKLASCIKCVKDRRDPKYMKLYKQQNRDKLNAYKRKHWRNQDPAHKAFLQARRRAKRKELEFTITEEELQIPSICPILKVPFKIGTKNSYEYTHSIDRIDNTKGYVKGNVQIISKKANSMKNSATPLELVRFAEWVLNNDDIVRAADIMLKQETAELLDKEPVR